MGLLDAMNISATGLNAQRKVIEVVATNLANAQTTRTESGGPYVRKQAILSESAPSDSFAQFLAQKMEPGPSSVKVDVVEEPTLGKVVFDPSHPDADESGSVTLPNVNVVEEMVDLLQATRSFEANVTAFNSAKQMALKALEIGSR
jgi:flagellar basal-body rod protein FlgC